MRAHWAARTGRIHGADFGRSHGSRGLRAAAAGCRRRQGSQGHGAYGCGCWRVGLFAWEVDAVDGMWYVVRHNAICISVFSIFLIALNRAGRDQKVRQKLLFVSFACGRYIMW